MQNIESKLCFVGVPSCAALPAIASNFRAVSSAGPQSPTPQLVFDQTSSKAAPPKPQFQLLQRYLPRYCRRKAGATLLCCSQADATILKRDRFTSRLVLKAPLVL